MSSSNNNISKLFESTDELLMDENNRSEASNDISSQLQSQKTALMKRLKLIDSEKLNLTDLNKQSGKAFWDSPHWNSNWNSNWDSNWHSNSY